MAQVHCEKALVTLSGMTAELELVFWHIETEIHGLTEHWMERQTWRLKKLFRFMTPAVSQKRAESFAYVQCMPNATSRPRERSLLAASTTQWLSQIAKKGMKTKTFTLTVVRKFFDGFQNTIIPKSNGCSWIQAMRATVLMPLKVGETK